MESSHSLWPYMFGFFHLTNVCEVPPIVACASVQFLFSLSFSFLFFWGGQCWGLSSGHVLAGQVLCYLSHGLSPVLL
jgi:hypothetical protein